MLKPPITEAIGTPPLRRWTKSVVFDLTRVAPDGQIYEGHEGVRAFWRMLRDVFGDFRTDPEEVIDGGDKLFALMHLRGSGQASGAPGEDFLYQVVTFRQGRAVRVEFFRDRAEARRAAGLSEHAAHPVS